MIKDTMLRFGVAALAIAGCASHPDPAPGLTTQQIAAKYFQFVPREWELLGAIISMRLTVDTGPTEFLICGPALSGMLNADSRKNLLAHRHWHVESTLAEVKDCGPLAAPPGARKTLVRIQEVVVGPDSAFAVARSLRAWDGRGDDYAVWLTERVSVEYRGTGVYNYSITGWPSNARD